VRRALEKPRDSIPRFFARSKKPRDAIPRLLKDYHPLRVAERERNVAAT